MPWLNCKDCLLILDEIQQFLGLCAVLRSLVDERRVCICAGSPGRSVSR